MISIEDTLNQIQATKRDIGAVTFFSNQHKKTREWMTLGATQHLLKVGGLNAPCYAVEKDPPDFETLDSDGKSWAHIEIVEVLPPGYKRHEFFKRDALPGAPSHYPVPPPLKEPWIPLRQALQEKAQKRYSMPVTLIVLFGIGRFAFHDWTTPFNEQLFAEHRREAFPSIERFSRVLVLNCDMKSLVELHPVMRTIVADDPFAI